MEILIKKANEVYLKQYKSDIIDDFDMEVLSCLLQGFYIVF